MNTIMFSPGVEVDGVFTFKDNLNMKVQLAVCKKETEEYAYKLAITYLGLDKDGKDSWSIKINDKSPFYDNEKLRCLSCRKLSIQPSGSGWKVTLPKYTVIRMKNISEPIILQGPQKDP